jgi:DNA-binding beta-propeller fold protein YncE
MTVVSKRIGGGIVALSALVALGGCGSGGSSSSSGSATGMAVINGDFISAAVSLLAPDGTLVTDDCIDSGTGAGGTLSFPLSGDITLPSQPQLDGKLWIVDRQNAAVTIVDPKTCTVDGQVSVGMGAKLNPHDALVVSDKKVYVTRFDKNLASTDPTVAGDDIVILDRDTGAITGHIDLAGYGGEVGTTRIQARPDRMVLVGGKVYVTLYESDAKFATFLNGRVAIIDPVTDTVTSRIELPGLKGCEGIYHPPGTNTLYVGCGGSFADGGDQKAASGVAAIDLSAPDEMKVTRASAFGQPVSFLWVAALSPTQVFTTTMGTFADPKNNIEGTKDKAFAFDPASGTTAALGLEAGPLDLGRGAVSEGKLYLPDATSDQPLVHVFDVSGTGAPTEVTSFDPDPAKKLPPREIAWY